MNLNHRPGRRTAILALVGAALSGFVRAVTAWVLDLITRG